MSDKQDWAFPDSFQPDPSELEFPLAAALDAVVTLRAEIPEHAYTAQVLGTQRSGSGVVINADGLILTVGYLITEAETIWLTANSGSAVAGHALAYDFATGFGLVQPLGRLATPSLEFGSGLALQPGDTAFMIGSGGVSHSLRTRIVDKREFAGYWEYVLDEALFTAPAHPQWGGAALVDRQGRLAGIGSLLLDELGDDETQGNMVIPIDLLPPILDDLLRHGRPSCPPRPWLGMYTAENEGQLVVTSLAPDGPAERSGIQEGDIVLEVNRQRPESLADLFRKIWQLGPAGTDIPLTLERKGMRMWVRVHASDRSQFLLKPRLH